MPFQKENTIWNHLFLRNFNIQTVSPKEIEHVLVDGKKPEAANTNYFGRHLRSHQSSVCRSEHFLALKERLADTNVLMNRRHTDYFYTYNVVCHALVFFPIKRQMIQPRPGLFNKQHGIYVIDSLTHNFPPESLNCPHAQTLRSRKQNWFKS